MIKRKSLKKTLNQIKDINEYLNKQYLMQKSYV